MVPGALREHSSRFLIGGFRSSIAGYARARSVVGVPVLGSNRLSRTIAVLSVAATAAVVDAAADTPPAYAYDAYPCGKQVWFPELGRNLQPCPLTSPLADNLIPVYRAPVPNPQGSPPPEPPEWLYGTENQYFECDQRFDNALYYHPSGWYNVWWARTRTASGFWGWVPEVFFKGGANNEPDYGLRTCPPPGRPPSKCDAPDEDRAVSMRARVRGKGRRGRVTTRYGRKVVVRGRLMTVAGDPVASARICVVEQSSLTGAAPRITGSLVTDANGGFAYTVPRGPSRRVSFVYRAGAAAAAAELDVGVRAPVKIRVSRRSLRTGQAVKFRGAVRGQTSRAGILVEMQVRRGGRWEALLGTTRTNNKGKFRDHYRFRYSTGVQRYSFRAHVPRQPGYAFKAGSSNRIRVRVRG
jgi:hypothetical protein